VRLEHFNWALPFAELLGWAQRSVSLRLIIWVSARDGEARFKSRLLLKSRNTGSLVLKIYSCGLLDSLFCAFRVTLGLLRASVAKILRRGLLILRFRVGLRGTFEGLY